LQLVYVCRKNKNLLFKKEGKNMSIIVNLDIMMARRKISLGELAEKVDITPANLSILKTGKARAIRFSTLEAICKILDCQPGDILEFRDDGKE
jgi:putative transcriptional regulator